jgi:transposase-like protein
MDHLSNEQKLTNIACSRCASHQCVRFGSNRGGTQRYICKDCGRTFTPDPARRGISQERVEQIKTLIANGQPITKVTRLLKVSPKTIYKVIRAAETEETPETPDV